MTEDPRVQQLLDELLAAQATPEEVCASCPELLPAVRKRWRQMCRLRADLEALFPPPDVPTLEPAEGPTLPQIPGYEVEAVLGRGGMGVVFQARHLRLNRLVALKMALAGAYAEPRERARFQREAEAVARLRHPNVVQIYDVGEADGRPHFTMELVDGGSLARKLAGMPQSARQAAQLVATLAGAMQAAHAGCGLVHRDLKPGNVLLTADGTPKISDFGLARRVGDGAGLTQTGVPVGTPSYMAPEQALGRPDALGPAVDVYALGAILYECLTGRPPFRAETAAATLQQVLDEEPVPPARLNPRVPRDLETICLKCLAKDPQRRYASAAALAEDLRRFERGEPITARPVGRLERLVWWVWRRPVLATLLVVGLLLALALAGGLLWLGWEQAATTRAVQDDLREVARLQEQFAWDRARAVLDRAEARLAGGGPAELRRRLAQSAADLKLATQLDEIRLNRAPLEVGELNNEQADRAYEEAFRSAGLGGVHDDPGAVGARARASAVSRALVAALGDWGVCALDKGRQAWVLAVARQADPDPQGWRDRVRNPDVWRDRSALAELARTAPLDGPSVPLLVAVGERLHDLGGDAAELLKRVQRKHPGDFWANYRLANALVKQEPRDAVGYYRAALAVRPGVVIVRNSLGLGLTVAGQFDEAIDHYRQILQVNPGLARVHNNLGMALMARGKLDEATACYRRALQLDPRYFPAHNNLGNVLLTRGRLDEAIDHYQKALHIQPRLARTHHNLGNALRDRGRLDEAIRHYQQAIRLDPNLAEPHHHLGEALQARGRLDEVIDHYQKALRIDPRLAGSHFKLGNLLQARGRTDEAIGHYRKALQSNPGLATAHNNLGSALRGKGRLDEAIGRCWSGPPGPARRSPRNSPRSTSTTAAGTPRTSSWSPRARRSTARSVSWSPGGATSARGTGSNSPTWPPSPLSSHGPSTCLSPPRPHPGSPPT
jgi:eukaryotic-like serine/threonine-protein kinase